jgi:hypothetical protein
MQKMITLLFLVAGIIHLMPITGVLGPDKLNTLYGLSFNEPNLQILMRHRAILFGLLGSLLVYAAFRPEIQIIALIGGLLSATSFLVIAWSTGGYNEAITKIVIADVVATVSLLIAALLLAMHKR